MCGSVIWMLLGIGIVSLATKGFSPGGMPLDRTRRITGPVAKIIGVVLLVLGFALILFAVGLARGGLRVK